MVAWNMTRTEVAIVAGARTPWTKLGGPMRSVHVADLAKRAFEEALYRASWKADRLDEVVLGNVVMPADAVNPARVSALYAGVPAHVPAISVLDTHAAKSQVSTRPRRWRGDVVHAP